MYQSTTLIHFFSGFSKVILPEKSDEVQFIGLGGVEDIRPVDEIDVNVSEGNRMKKLQYKDSVSFDFIYLSVRPTTNQLAKRDLDYLKSMNPPDAVG